MSQIDTENDKKPKIFQISYFMHFLLVSTDFLDWNVLNGQQGKGWLSSSFL